MRAQRWLVTAVFSVSPPHTLAEPPRCRWPQVRLTVVEIYCERIRDLLDPLGRDNLPIKQGLDGGTYVEGEGGRCSQPHPT